MIRGLLLLCVCVMVIAGCSSKPTEQVVVGDLIQRVDFDALSIWQEYVHPEQNVDFEIKDGAYEAKAWDGGFNALSLTMCSTSCR